MKNPKNVPDRRRLILAALLLPILLASYWKISQDDSASQKDWDADRQNLPDITALEQRIEIDLFGVEPASTQGIGADIDLPLDIEAMESKLAGLTKNVTTLRQPTEQELLSYFQQHQGDYRRDSYFSFQQILFSTAKYGGQAYDRAKKTLLDIAADDISSNASGPLKERYYGASSSDIDREFGNNFSSKIIALSIEGDGTMPCWAGPITSGYGAHLVCIEKLTLGEIPDLEDVRAQVVNDWRYWISESED